MIQYCTFLQLSFLLSIINRLSPHEILHMPKWLKTTQPHKHVASNWPAYNYLSQTCSFSVYTARNQVFTLGKFKKLINLCNNKCQEYLSICSIKKGKIIYWHKQMSANLITYTKKSVWTYGSYLERMQKV